MWDEGNFHSEFNQMFTKICNTVSLPACGLVYLLILGVGNANGQSGGGHGGIGVGPDLHSGKRPKKSDGPVHQVDGSHAGVGRSPGMSQPRPAHGGSQPTQPKRKDKNLHGGVGLTPGMIGKHQVRRESSPPPPHISNGHAPK